MRHGTTVALVISALALAACGPAELVVTAEVEVQDPSSGETVMRSLEDIQVRLLPFDRDAVFDSLTAAAERPEPPIPQEILDQQAAIADAQQEWREQDSRWSALRDRLQRMSDQLEDLHPGQAQYVALFREWQDLEAQYNRAERASEAAFERYDELSKESLTATQEIRIERENWADEAFADVTEVFAAKIRASGLDAYADTTAATGVARFQVDPGQYWVTARYELPFTELYWNVPVTVQRGEPVTLTLNNENAEERPIL